MAIIDGAMQAVSPTLAHGVAGFRTEIKTLDREMAHLAESIATGQQYQSILDALQARQERRRALVAAITAHEAADVRRFDRKALEMTIRYRVQYWRTLLSKSVEDGRRVLREVLSGPLRFTPVGRTYRFEGEAEAAIGPFIAGVAGLPTVMASPIGTTRRWLSDSLAGWPASEVHVWPRERRRTQPNCPSNTSINRSESGPR
jgi:RNA-splicing ligase RtcB